MPSHEDFGEIRENSRTWAEELCVIWRIRNVLSLPGGSDDCYKSPFFKVGDKRWCLSMWPNWKMGTGNTASAFLRLGIHRSDRGRDLTFHISVHIRGSRGAEKGRLVEWGFTSGDDNCYILDDFCSRSELKKNKSRLMPDGLLNIMFVWRRVVPGAVICVLPHPHPSIQVAPNNGNQSSNKREIKVLREEMKTLRQQIIECIESCDGYRSEISSYKSKIADLEKKLLLNEKNYEERIQTSFIESSKMRKDNDLLKKEVEFYVEQIKTLQKTVENYLESENYKKQISALESEKLSIAEEHKCLLEEKLKGLEKKNEVLRAEMKTLIQQIKDYVKSNDGYCSEIISYKSKIRDIENILLLNENYYGEQMQASLNESSNIRKDNDLLKKTVECFVEQIKILQNRVENYELESENYKKQIRALESEKSSIAEEHKCVLEEKLTIVSEHEKVNQQLKKEVEFLMEQNKNLNGKYEEQVHNFCKASSELRKACMNNELLKREMDSLSEQIKTHERTGENYMSKSENYNKQINTLESELMVSCAEQYKCPVRSAIASVHDKAAFDDHAEEENNDYKNDAEDDKESKIKSM